MISPLLAMLYGIILEKKLSIWLESEGKRILQSSTQQKTTSLCLGSLWRNAAMINPISFVALWTLERLSIRFLETIFGKY